MQRTWHTWVVIVKPGGTLRPRCAISQRFAPLPPSCGAREGPGERAGGGTGHNSK